MNHYRIDEPFVISFSGGRTSGFMLRMILDAFGGSIPSGSHVCFANTGKEHEATLEFVRDISERWGVDIVWVERMFRQDPSFRIVDFTSASRNGEPFADLIKKKNYLPNPIARFCTEELKVRAISAYLKSIGVQSATMAIGLRADEPRRVHRVQGDVRNGLDYDCPMSRAGHTIDDVLAFWKQQPFDLRLPNDDRAFGNCDLCFLKSRSMTDRVISAEPERAKWWIEQENAIGGTFRKDRPKYEQILHQVRIQPGLFGDDDDSATIPCTCTD